MTHPVIVLVSDTMWSGVVLRQFILSKIWFIMSLFLFMLSQAVLPKLDNQDKAIRVLVFLGRIFNYTVGMGRLSITHYREFVQAYRERDTSRCCGLRLPNYLRDPIHSGSFVLTILLALMCTHEPMFWCINPDAIREFPEERCPEAIQMRWRYSVFCLGAMAIHWLLLVDLAVFSTGLSAFVLVVGQVLSEMSRFAAALIFLVLAFSTAIAVLEHDYFPMRDIPNAAIVLWSMTIRMFQDDFREVMAEPALLAAVYMFVTASWVVLVNLLTAQINCSYVFIYQDMVGFARLQRAGVIVDTLENCPQATWTAFVESLCLNQPLEFNQGDVGPPGGIQVLEGANEHPVTQDHIQRFGGSCSVDQPWPEEATQEEENKYERLENLLQKVLRRAAREEKKFSSGGGGGSRRRRVGDGSSGGSGGSMFSGGSGASGGTGGTGSEQGSEADAGDLTGDQDF